MNFLRSDFTIKILSVQKLNWQFNNANVAPRPYNALSFRIKGSSDFSNGRTTSHLNDNDILFMPKNVGYHLTSGTEELIVIHFELQGEDQDFFEVITPEHAISYKNIFESILSDWNDREQGYYFKAMSHFYMLLSKLDKKLCNAYNPAYSKIKKSAEYINKNFTDPDIDLSVLCSLSGMSDTYFRKQFYYTYGTTPLKFINKLRIDYAVELLDTGYYTIEYVARKCGFYDPKYFCTVFKKYKHCAPSAYRSNHR